MPAAVVGGKASHVSWLVANGERVPETWVITPDVPGNAVHPALGELPSGVRVAVRSSASVEDGLQSSYAGQFISELDVEHQDLAAAVQRVRESAGSERVQAYRQHLGQANGVSMNVMVQPMVTPKVSGVSFSRNPMTGLNEVVVEAVTGRGDRLVDDGVTPQRWIHRWGSWIEQPVEPILDDVVARSIVDSTRRIAEEYGRPVDLEWVWDGTEVWWVQLRPITGLADIGVYSNRISREVMPGIIKPLVWSVNVPMVNRAWVELFTEVLGPNDIEPESLARAFAYRSYFNMGAIGDIFELLGMPRDSLELLLGLPPGPDQPSFKPTAKTMRKLPSMLRLAAQKARYRKVVGGEVTAIAAAYRPFDREDLAGRSDSALLADVAALSEIGVRAAYANIVTPLLANLYNAALRRRLGAAGLDPEAIEPASIAGLEDVNPNIHLDRLGERLAGLDGDAVAAIRDGGYHALGEGLRHHVDAFLERFGHLSASGNDFSVAPWRETPDAVVGMILDHAATHGAAERMPWETAASRIGPLRRVLASHLRVRTQEFVEHRERVSFTYTYGYGLFRRYFIEIGRRLTERGRLDAADDVMYLYLDEVRQALQDGSVDCRVLVGERKAEIESLEDVEMPEVIYGEVFTPVKPGPANGSLHGIPTSRGRYRGTLRVVRTVDDFGRVDAGDVIAIPYSDVGWTPLFARAGAVVAEAGGMLSHSSIVAREYRIPCVVSVPGATRLPDGATVTVDGFAGTVVVEGDPT